MIFQGSKSRIAKDIVPIIQKYIDDWCRQLAKDNIVIISEYWMPDDFKCIWTKERKVMQKSDRVTADIATEKLFIKGFKDEL